MSFKKNKILTKTPSVGGNVCQRYPVCLMNCQVTTLNCCWTHWFTLFATWFGIIYSSLDPTHGLYFVCVFFLWIWCCKGKKWEIHRTLEAAGPPVGQWCVLNRGKNEGNNWLHLCVSHWVKDLWESFCITQCWRPVTPPAHHALVCVHGCVSCRGSCTAHIHQLK